MTPPPPKPRSVVPPAPRPLAKKNLLQPNRSFDNVEEIQAYIKNSYPKQVVNIVKTWPTNQIACTLEIGDKPPEVKGKK